MPGDKLINIGFGNYVLAGRVVGIVNPSSSPMKRLREDARAEGRPPRGAKRAPFW